MKGDPTSPPALWGPGDAGARLCLEGHSEGPRGTGTAAARETLSGPKETACPYASWVSQGQGPEQWGIPIPGDAPTHPDSVPSDLLQLWRWPCFGKGLGQEISMGTNQTKICAIL